MKRLFVVRIGNYRKELCAFTIPTIKAWCANNGWEYNEITERKFPTRPVTAEKMQVRELVSGCEWAMLVDADVMLRPDTEDLSIGDPCVFSSYELKTKDFFYDLSTGLSGGYYGAYKDYFDLWNPPVDEADWQHCLKNIYKPHVIDEYIVSRNLERMNPKPKFEGVAHFVDAKVVHLGSELIKDGIDEGVSLAMEKWLDWIEIWPHLKNFS